MPTLYVIGGPNGAGKTTAALELLPNFLDCKEYVNADAIAAGLSPFNVEGVAVQAGRLLLERINQLAEDGVDFAFESTLSAKIFAGFIEKCKTKGYKIVLIYVWLESADLAIERVAKRVKNGGHHIPNDVVLRRYKRV